MNNGQKLQYIGKGFLGYNPIYTEMSFISNEGANDLWVWYFGGDFKGKMLVRKSEVV